MAQAELHVNQVFPVGTVVKAYAGELVPPSGSPAFPQVAQATVAADGKLTISGLAPASLFVAWAVVNGADAYVRFNTLGQATGKGATIEAPFEGKGAVPLPTGVSTLIAPANPDRHWIELQDHDAAEDVYLGVGEAAALNNGLSIRADGPGWGTDNKSAIYGWPTGTTTVIVGYVEL